MMEGISIISNDNDANIEKLIRGGYLIVRCYYSGATNIKNTHLQLDFNHSSATSFSIYEKSCGKMGISEFTLSTRTARLLLSLSNPENEKVENVGVY